MSVEPGGERLISDRYRLLAPLGEGGMGTVWRARDEVLHREVAVKEVRPPAGLGADDIQRMYARLEREAWAAARVANRNVVTVYDVVMQDGRPWIVMELVPGITMAELLEAEGPLEPSRAAWIGAEVLSALRAAHGAGVLHRDVKPANVLLSNDGRVVLTDFGIATMEGSSALTMTGEVIGSPEFLSPERAMGRTPGPESDLWSLGVLLYAAVEGSSPFRHDTPLSTLRAIVDEELPPPRRAGPLAPVIAGLLAKDPARRLAADEAEHDLRIVAAGGTLRQETAPTTPYAPYSPTVAAQQPSYDEPRNQQPTYQQQALAPTRRDGGNRRAGALLIAGILVVALALAGIVYALVNNRNDKQAQGGGQTNSQSQGVSPPPVQSSASPEESHNSPSPSPSQRQQTVSVSVSGDNTQYDGSCPPARSDAPVFTATFTVGRTPAAVEYRWVSKDGQADSGWQTLNFRSGESSSQQARVFLTAYAKAGTFTSELWVEVRGPAKATSNSVPYSVTCEPETPSSGTSGSPSPSAS